MRCERAMETERGASRHSNNSPAPCVVLGMTSGRDGADRVAKSRGVWRELRQGEGVRQHNVCGGSDLV